MVKYSPASGAGSRWREGIANARLLSVSDQGMGIAPDELPHVFESYYRGGSAMCARLAALAWACLWCRKSFAITTAQFRRKARLAKAARLRLRCRWRARSWGLLPLPETPGSSQFLRPGLHGVGVAALRKAAPLRLRVERVQSRALGGRH